MRPWALPAAGGTGRWRDGAPLLDCARAAQAGGGMDLRGLTSVGELLSYIVVVLGVPWGLLQYHQAKAREQEEREWRAYDGAWAAYMEFQRLCLEHPHLDLFGLPDAAPMELTPLQQKQETIACTMLFSVFERAYLVYAERPTRATAAQWRGWDQLIGGYFTRAAVRRAWQSVEGGYDPRFEAYLRRVATETAAGDGAPPAAAG